jgi:parallel beta-helix repeat protein
VASVQPSRRLLTAVALLALIGAYVLASRWYGAVLPARAAATASVQASVTSGADRGPGSLREALFTAAGASGSARIVVRVPRITVDTPLPPLVNPHGLSIVVASGTAELDARALGTAPVLDVDAAHVSVSGLAIRNCRGTAILVRAGDFHLTAGSIERCDVGVDVAEGVRAVELAHNSFSGNRLSVRFASTGADVLVVGNRFDSDTDAGVWAVRGKSDVPDPTPIDVRDNRFSNDRVGIVAGNIPMRLEQNIFNDAREAAVHLLGAGTLMRGNRISGGAAMGIVVENATAAAITDNEIDHVEAYGILIRGSANALVRSNQLHNCGYGMAFVLGDERYPSTAADNIILSTRYNGIDVIGDSPILRHNHVRQAHALALHVEDYQPAGSRPVRAHPFLDGNDWGNEAAAASRAHLTGTGSSR